MNMEHRFGWIEACLIFTGQFSGAEKKVYCDYFGVSESTVSRDQDAFLTSVAAAKGEGLVAKVNGKLVLEDGAVLRESQYRRPSRELWLSVTLGQRFASAPNPRKGTVDDGVLRLVIKSIQKRRVMRINYHSRSGSVGWRAIAPHTIADVVGRYHVRAWDYAHSRYADFVLSRIRSAVFDLDKRLKYRGSDRDDEWRNFEDVEIRPDGEINPASARLDYGLGEDDRRVIKVRAALVGYVIDHEDGKYTSPVKISRCMPPRD